VLAEWDTHGKTAYLLENVLSEIHPFTPSILTESPGEAWDM